VLWWNLVIRRKHLRRIAARRAALRDKMTG